MKKKLQTTVDDLLEEMTSKVYTEFNQIRDMKKLSVIREKITSMSLESQNNIRFQEDTGSLIRNKGHPTTRRSQSMYESQILTQLTNENQENKTLDLLAVKNFLISLKEYSVASMEDYHVKQLKRMGFIESTNVFEFLMEIIKKHFALTNEFLEKIWENETTPFLADKVDLVQGFSKIMCNITKISSMPNFDTPFKSGQNPKPQPQLQIMGLLENTLNIFLLEWGKNEFYKSFMINKIYKSLNKKRPDSLSLINVKDFTLSTDIYKMSNMRIVKFSGEEVVFEFDYVFKGNMCLFLNFAFHLDTSILQREIKIDLAVPIREIVSAIRVKYRPRHAGKSWFCFMGLPQMKYELKPKINDIDFDLNLYLFNVGDIIVKNGLKNVIYPQWSSIGIPLTKKRKLFKPGI